MQSVLKQATTFVFRFDLGEPVKKTGVQPNLSSNIEYSVRHKWSMDVSAQLSIKRKARHNVHGRTSLECQQFEYLIMITSNVRDKNISESCLNYVRVPALSLDTSRGSQSRP